MVPSATNCLQTLLQTAVQSVQWTYSLFWQLCPQQGILVWGNGYYNGAIKTRKTVQPMEVSAEEASLQRSEQLRELYDSLSTGTGDTNQPARRPSAALSPEDLTESEWFYLMCVSFSFPPGVGLPGKAYTKRKHVWLTGASEIDSKVFSRAILAKSARIQTVVCIPLLDGVVELGTTEKVQEDLGFVQRVKSFFIDHAMPLPQTPALSGHSSSNPAMTPTMPPMYTQVDPLAYATNQMDEEEEEEEQEEEDDDNEEDGDEEEDEESYAADQAETHSNNRFSSVQNLQAMAQDLSTAADHDQAVAEPSEVMHLDLSEDIRFGSPNDGSKNLDSDFHLLAVSQVGSIAADCQGRADTYRAESTPRLQDQNPLSNCLDQLQASGALSLEELTQKDTHYSHTLSTILHHQSNRWSNSCSARYARSTQSVFAKWTLNPFLLPRRTKAASQWVLKYVLFTVPFLHTNSKSRNGTTDSATRFRKATPHDELSANHMLAERRRREKLNERFIILRSLVPFVTKMDKASILGDTIEYLKQLRKKIQDLEARTRQVELNQRSSKGGARMWSDKRKLRIVEDGGTAGKPKAVDLPKDTTVAGKAMQVEVSIIESDALVELQCPYREGLLLDVMHVLRELLLEITTVQSSLNGGVFAVEMRAKVKHGVNRKKVSIMEVKRAIDQIIPPH